MSDIKETKEALTGIFTLWSFINDRLKDGFGLDDVAAFYSKMASDKVFKGKVIEALRDSKEIPEELKGLDLSKLIELSLLVGPEIIMIVGKMDSETLIKFNNIIEKLIPLALKGVAAKKTGA